MVQNTCSYPRLSSQSHSTIQSVITPTKMINNRIRPIHIFPLVRPLRSLFIYPFYFVNICIEANRAFSLILHPFSGTRKLSDNSLSPVVNEIKLEEAMIPACFA